MKKTIRFIAPVFVVVMAVLLSACSLFTYTVTFVDHNGQFIQEKTYSNSESVTNQNGPYSPNRLGFTFSKWEDVEDENLKKNFKTDRVMQATYTINVNDSVFQESGRRLDWSGYEVSATTEFSAGETKIFLIRDLSSYSNFEKFSIRNADGSAFSPETITVYDQNGKVCRNNSIMWGDWIPDPLESMGEYDFVVEVTADTAGLAEIILL